MACSLPDEVWTEALRTGVLQGILNYRDLCSLSITCSFLHRLSCASNLWMILCQRDFPHDSSSSFLNAPFKTMYKCRFEKIKATKVAAHKRQVLRLQSEAANLENECKELNTQIQTEKLKLSNIVENLKNIEQTRISSVALKMWQPHAVHAMQQRLVEQQPIDLEFHENSLKMESRICKEEINKCSRRIAQNKLTIEKLKKDLEFLTYNPVDELNVNLPRKRSRKLKREGFKA